MDGNVKIWDTKSILSFKDYEMWQKEGQTKGIGTSIGPLRRPISSMSRHNGAVTCVKFSPDGRFLATGSDDRIALIWEKDENAVTTTQFGETEADLERWSVRKRLVAHDNDIQDICWSPDGSLLVTVGLDRLIIIWSGLTFERIKRYDIHQSMVKGIVFDPANKFFATASDDRTVRIFRYHRKLTELNSYEFQMEHIVVEPFKKSPLTSYYRRMSWSPDGQNVAVPNAINGSVTSIAIINRDNWTTDVSLIGHFAPTEVCAFSPRLYDIENEEDTSETPGNSYSDLSSILASAGQDRSLVIWSTTQSTPLLVAQDIVLSSITDICWENSGQALYLSSLDGSITCVTFESNELGKVVGEDINESQLHRYGADRESTMFPESVEQLILEEKSDLLEQSVPKASTIPKPVTQSLEKQTANVTPSSSAINDLTPHQRNKQTQSVTITKDGKKRVSPFLISSTAKSSTAPLNSISKVTKKALGSTQISQPFYYYPRAGLQTSVLGFKLRNSEGERKHDRALEDDADNDNEDMGIDSTNNGSEVRKEDNTTMSASLLRRRKGRLKRSILERRYPNTFIQVSDLPEVLFNNQAILNAKVNSTLNGNSSNKEISQEPLSGSFIDAIDESLIFAVIVKAVKSCRKKDLREIDIELGRPKEFVSVLEVRNATSWESDDLSLGYELDEKNDFNDPSTVLVSNNFNETSRDFTIYFPFRIQHVVPILLEGVLIYYALISFHGVVQLILAWTGRYACPNMELGDNVVVAKSNQDHLMCVTSRGSVYSWKVSEYSPALKGVVRGASLAPIVNSVIHLPSFDPSKQAGNKKSGEITPVFNSKVKSIDLNPRDGTPIVALQGNNDVFSYSLDMMAWIKLVDSWLFLACEKLDIERLKSENSAYTLLYKSYSSFLSDVRKAQQLVYVFDNDRPNELRSSMKTRFLENFYLLRDYV